MDAVGMPWAPVDHGFSSHPKVVALLDRDDDEGMTALGMWALLLPVVRDQADPCHPERAGVVSRSLLRRWAGPRGESLAKLLVEARDDHEHGLWEVHPQGWRYHNFIERSGLAEWWAKSAQARRAAQARWGPPDTSVNADADAGAYADAMRTDMQQDKTGQDKNNLVVGRAKRAPTRLPPGFAPSAEDIAAIERVRPDVNWRAETARFTAYWQAKPGKGGEMKDWPMTWRNWMRKARGGHFPADDQPPGAGEFGSGDWR